MNKIIVFDVDRTIVDSFTSELYSLQKAIEIVTGNKLSAESLSETATMTTTELYKMLNLSENKIKELEHVWEIEYQKYKITCFEGIEEVIIKLHKKGYILGIITSRTLEEYHSLDSILKNIKDLFSSIVTSDKVVNPKPSRDSIDYLCNELKCNASDIIYIGDSNTDKIFAKNSKIKFIPVCWDNKELTNDQTACHRVEDLFTAINNVK